MSHVCVIHSINRHKLCLDEELYFLGLNVIWAIENWCFGRINRLHLQGRRINQTKDQQEARDKQGLAGFLLCLLFDPEDGGKFSSETSVDFKRNRGVISENTRTLHNRYCENFKTCKMRRKWRNSKWLQGGNVKPIHRSNFTTCYVL
jgi:hypothetical protein